jgi:3-methyladenine DNA glycosylase AlkD
MKARSRSFSTPKKRSSQVATQDNASRWTTEAVLRELRGLALSAPVLHQFAKKIGKNHRLAQQLWATGIHEARILATLIGESEKVTAAEMDRWARDFDSWDVVDAACCYLYAQAKPAWKKTAAWSRRPEEFVKRASFSLVAYLAYKDKAAPDLRFAQFLRVIEREAHEERNFVKKAVNWALRNIGKRNVRLNREAIRAAERIREQGSRSARWITADALRELKSEAVQQRLHRKTT